MQTTMFRTLRLRPLSTAKPIIPSLKSPHYRHFSITRRRDVSVSEMSESELKAVKINRDRLWRDLHSTCEWGKGERWGE